MKAWPPNYTEVFLKRQKRLLEIKKDPILQVGAIEYYKTRPIEFIEDWCITYDPRNVGNQDRPPLMPFNQFPRQRELVMFFMDCLRDKESGLIEKTRDMGATWLATAFSVWMWRFHDGAGIGWGSRKEQLVEKIGDPDSIFEKMRMQIDYLPRFFMPKGFDRQKHCSYMKILNPDNGASITGESGDNIGRGGRKTIYWKDESAHYERPEKIEAALGHNTTVQIDISSVNGNANVFARRRKAGIIWEPGCKIKSGKTRVFILDWRDHPLKTQEWYDKLRLKHEDEGLNHIFAQEVDRDYAASVEGILIKPAWVQAAIDFHDRYSIKLDGLTYGGLDIADEGGDKNALAMRKSILIKYVDNWGKGDAGESAIKAVKACREKDIANYLFYDCIGVGATVKAEVNRLTREGFKFGMLKVIPWAASAGVLRPEENVVKGDKESPKNKDTFKNLKAQAYWALRTRFQKVYKYVTEGKKYPIDELISINGRVKNLHSITQQLSQPTYSRDGSGRIIVDKKPSGTKSPDMADAICMAFFPVPERTKRVGAW